MATSTSDTAFDLASIHILLATSALSFATQPVFSASKTQKKHCDSDAVLYKECLARLENDGGRSWTAEQFISALEQAGAVSLLDRRMLTLVLEHLASDPTAVLGCNLSADNLASPDAWNAVLDLIRARPDLASRLVLELTETRPLDDPKRATAMLAEARKLGCRVALDDFGIGFASPRLAQLIGADIIKIDKSFVVDVRPSPDGSDSLRHLVGFASSCAPIIVVEGIETIEQANTAHAAGATHLQGYLFCRPVPANDVGAPTRVTS